MAAPVPARLTVRVNCCTLKVALTVRATLIVTVQVEPTTVLHPFQLPKIDPLAGAAVSVTLVLLS